MGWTDERVEMLKQLWTEGLSASQIAEKLGGVSRNAVIGKVHRLKLESRVKSVSSAAPAPSPAAPQTVERPALQPRHAEVEMDQTVVSPRFSPPPQHSAPQRSMPRTIGATALKMDPDEERELMEAQETVLTTGEVVPIARKLTLVQLTESTCKWPVGDPLKPDFHFCGNSARDASPYCAYHAKLAFQPASERRRVR